MCPCTRVRMYVHMHAYTYGQMQGEVREQLEEAGSLLYPVHPRVQTPGVWQPAPLPAELFSSAWIKVKGQS